jgi:predicted transcriptional regulator
MLVETYDVYGKGWRIPEHLATSRNRILYIIQPQPRIHFATIVLPCNAESNTLQSLPFPCKRRRIHLKLIQVVPRTQSRKSDDAEQVAPARFPTPDANRTFRLRNATNTSICERVQIKSLLWWSK